MKNILKSYKIPKIFILTPFFYSQMANLSIKNLSQNGTKSTIPKTPRLNEWDIN